MVERCTSTKHMLPQIQMGMYGISTCGLTAILGDGPFLPLVRKARLAPMSMPVLAPTSRVRLLILRGVHARTVALRSAHRLPLPLLTPTS